MDRPGLLTYTKSNKMREIIYCKFVYNAVLHVPFINKTCKFENHHKKNDQSSAHICALSKVECKLLLCE